MFGQVFRAGGRVFPRIFRAGVGKEVGIGAVQVGRRYALREAAGRSAGIAVTGAGVGAGVLGVGYLGGQGVEALSGSAARGASLFGQGLGSGFEDLLSAPAGAIDSTLSALGAEQGGLGRSLLLPAALVGGAVLLSNRRKK